MRPLLRTSVLKDQLHGTTVMKDHCCETTVMKDHCYGRSLLWKTTVMEGHCCERPLLWKATVMEGHCYGRPLLWKAAVMKGHCYERPPSAEFLAKWPTFHCMLYLHTYITGEETRAAPGPRNSTWHHHVYIFIITFWACCRDPLPWEAILLWQQKGMNFQDRCIVCDIYLCKDARI